MLLIIVFLPLISAFITILFGQALGRNGARVLTRSFSILNFFFSLGLIIQNLTKSHLLNVKIRSWRSSELLQIHWSFNLDNLTLTMFFVVNLISCLVHRYSTSYRSEDPHLPRFMSYLSLFTFFRLILVTGDSIVQLFVGWEGVGICSYLLISFWYTRIPANKAAIKALIVNRISDVALTLARLTRFATFRATEFSVMTALAPYRYQQTSSNAYILTTITILLRLGARGKSAQIFLHTWLPDAREGPTPVSALIHAATRVTAGVFLIIKSATIFEYADNSLILLTLVGGLTAFFSSTVGLVQTDRKKVIAYSTCSQLGYRVFACGLSAYNVSLFHLRNHAIFKALLFLSAGAVIHSRSHEQDIRRRGGLSKRLPFVYASRRIGSFALIGFPFLTGYYSKDLRLELAYSQYNLSGSFVHWLATLTAGFTTFYSFRLIYFSFIRASVAHPTVAKQIHESPWARLFPLTILAVLSIFWGFLSKDAFVGVGNYLFDHIRFIQPERNTLYRAEFLPFYIKNLPFFLSLFSVFRVFVLYRNRRFYGLVYHKTFRQIHGFLSAKWFFDLFYNRYRNEPVLQFSYKVIFKLLDKGLIELCGPFGVYELFKNVSLNLRNLETGIVYYYSAYILISFVFLLYRFS